MDRPVFDIVSVEALNNTCVLRGRAWEDIRVNDVVVADYIEGDDQDRQLTIVSIETYGHSVSELSRMMTGSLVVAGRNVHLLRSDSKLVAQKP